MLLLKSVLKWISHKLSYVCNNIHLVPNCMILADWGGEVVAESALWSLDAPLSLSVTAFWVACEYGEVTAAAFLHLSVT